MEIERLDSNRLSSLTQSRDFEQVQRICEKILSQPGSIESEKIVAHHFLGVSYYLQGKLSQSIEQFKKALSIDPKFTDSAISLSVLYNDIGKYDEAKKIFQVANQALQLKRQGFDPSLDRKFALKHIEMGDLYFKYHRYDEAMEDYSKALSLDSTFLDVRIKIAKALAKKGFTTRAVQELSQLCREHPEFLQGRLQLGLMHFSLGNVIDAQLEWEKALQENPDNPEIQNYLDMIRQSTETSF
jgi:tetratricopeptide (TPR) repeat protein